MATPIANGDVFAVRIASFVGSQLGLNDVAYKVTGLVSSSGTTCENLPALLDAVIGPLYAAWLPSTGSYYGLSLTRVFGGAIQPGVTVTGSAGGVAGGCSAKQVAGLVQKKTAFGGRSGRGRIYVPFVPASYIAGDGELTLTGKTALATLAAGVFATIPISFPGPGACDLVPQLVKRSPLTFTAITSFLARSTPATQRRRGDYGKLNGPPW